MRHTLRQMIDNVTAAKNAASPAALQVSKTIQDPVGTTKEGFEDLQQKKLEYEMAKSNMQRTLLPVQSVIQHVNQTHGIAPNPADASMGYQNMDDSTDPNDPEGGSDQNLPTGPGVNPNQAQAPGKMNMNRPSQAGFQPGVAPGQQKSVVPGKKGMPSPGGNKVNPGNPEAKQYNPTAKPPRGSGKLPANPKKAGAKPGKGGPVTNKTGHQIKISVNSAADRGIRPNVPKLNQMMAAASLQRGRFEVEAGGPGSGCKGPNCGRKGGGGNFHLQMQYRGNVKGEDVAPKDRMEKMIATIRDQFGGRHFESPHSGRMSGGELIYHHMTFPDAKSAVAAHDKLHKIGLRGADLSYRKGGHTIPYGPYTGKYISLNPRTGKAWLDWQKDKVPAK